ncbi:threonylcarbamoyl-AMP synthase [Chlorobium sp. BLA1]|uniref:L-threonylcarbamoyladenylate synthase n=1 Tax=Candidatus Chlorobium masyuteum TaxID=2716876 RepID=UPI00141F35CD|nr:L-threonylcarbamoyladenylate synthase [Candidatus Chlorobium masyuteum]NHQ59281.1 threonylcarbamoyl-AMP synthase [Candidatus Chlorobium masyuteum]
MQTILTDSTEEAARILNSGCVVAFPTETVYGLGACICHPEAIGKIFQAKGRPGDNPLIVHIYNLKQLYDVASEINESAEKLIERFFPGPLTLVLKKKQSVPDIVTAGLDTVGVRCPANPVAREFLRLACGPVAAPSANISGLPSSTSWQSVFNDLDGRISCILKGEESPIGLESTIVDCSGPSPVLLRAGAITFEALQKVVPGITLNTGTGKESRPKSPGLKYLHYAPKASIVLCTPLDPITAAPDSAYIGIAPPPEGVRVARHCISPEEYGRELFRFFRLCDAEGIRVIYCELPSPEGLGRAIRDRLTRAAGKESG